MPDRSATKGTSNPSIFGNFFLKKQAYLPGNEGRPYTSDNETEWKSLCTISGEHTRAVYDISWFHQTNLIATACGNDYIRIFKQDRRLVKERTNIYAGSTAVNKAHL